MHLRQRCLCVSPARAAAAAAVAAVTINRELTKSDC